jgi:hypothetical protein
LNCGVTADTHFSRSRVTPHELAAAGKGELMDTRIATGGAFALNPGSRATMHVLGGRIPILLVDRVFDEPEQLRTTALQLSYAEPGTAYPGRIAELDQNDQSLQLFLGKVLQLVNEQYLPRVPPISADGKPIARFRSIHADFAITDLHPDQLQPTQRKPHIDPVAIFGLVYLNPQPRGGTLFFDRVSTDGGEEPSGGYFTVGDAEFRPLGRIDGLFNRLAVYPGFVLHSGEIAGEWIKSDERFVTPRLTLRLAFLP